MSRRDRGRSRYPPGISLGQLQGRAAARDQEPAKRPGPDRGSVKQHRKRKGGGLEPLPGRKAGLSFGKDVRGGIREDAGFLQQAPPHSACVCVAPAPLRSFSRCPLPEAVKSRVGLAACERGRQGCWDTMSRACRRVAGPTCLGWPADLSGCHGFQTPEPRRVRICA
ncbi:hypothetical protein AAFF_G00180930 [Aldrovandia affinis]|uniref:Uncharacterized protein n=1 Tax=Aldrovandia affinis TaxID=143900 RepID=A0AAD7WW16_9TELE|nr:hypothetical protein AAFF_G00180930 [Aldrovandia affinis]